MKKEMLFEMKFIILWDDAMDEYIMYQILGRVIVTTNLGQFLLYNLLIAELNKLESLLFLVHSKTF